MSALRILSVGQCSFDHGSISRHLQKHFGAMTIKADSHEKALAELHANPVDLVLVNRVTDEDGSLGVELIRLIKSDSTLADVPVMLVSNYPEAQQAAMNLGALKGFGKSDIRGSQPLVALEQAILQPR